MCLLKTAWSALCSSSQAQMPMDCSSVVQLQQGLWIFLRQLVRRRRTLAYTCKPALRTRRFHTIGHTIGEAMSLSPGRHSVGTNAWTMRAFVMRCPWCIIRRIGREGVSILSPSCGCAMKHFQNVQRDDGANHHKRIHTSKALRAELALQCLAVSGHVRSALKYRVTFVPRFALTSG